MFGRKTQPQQASPQVALGPDGGIPEMADGANLVTSSRYGPFMVNRHDVYIGRAMQTYGEYSPAEMACFAKWVQPGGVAVEVGANIGAFSVGLSRLVTSSGTLFVFEPQRQVFQMLCANLALSQCHNVHAYQYGLGPASSVLTLPEINYDTSGNFGGIALGASGSEQVIVYPLDRWQLSACQFIKIDVEGMELDVLRGAEQTIRSCRPVLYVEDDRRDAHPELISLIDRYGYDMYWHIPPIFSPDNFKGVRDDVLGATYSVNLLCLPKELNVVRDVTRDIKTYGSLWESWSDLPGDYP